MNLEIVKRVSLKVSPEHLNDGPVEEIGESQECAMGAQDIFAQQGFRWKGLGTLSTTPSDCVMAVT